MTRNGSLHKAAVGEGKPGPNPTDRGKGGDSKSGVKRSRLTEARGIPVGLGLNEANRQEKKLTESPVTSLPAAAEAARAAHRAGGEQPSLCLEAGYD